MTYKNVRKNLEKLDGTVLVVGDIMLDKYTPVRVRGVSPEGAHLDVMPLADVQPRMYPGGAANSAFNVAAFGGNVTLIGLRGVDAECVASETYRTIVKERLADYHFNWQPMMRISHEQTVVDKIDKDALVERIKEQKGKADVVLVSDYAKGVITSKTMDAIYGLDVPVIIDTRPQHAELYKGAFLLTPNLKEAGDITGVKGEVHKVSAALKKMYKHANVLITAGADGMYLYSREEGTHALSAISSGMEVIDNSGAGDTVAAMMALGIASKLSLVESMELANLAAGVVVRKRGTGTATREEILSLNRAL